MSKSEWGEVANTDVGRFACQRWRELGENPSLVDWRELFSQDSLERRLEDELIDAIVVPKRNAVELVVADTPKWEVVEIVVRVMIDRGWDVSVLAPLACLGSAHDALHGASASVQGWWARDDRTYSFTQREHA